jgi:predicted phage terminase large subunit-like protein
MPSRDKQMTEALFTPAEIRNAEIAAARKYFRIFAKVMHEELFPGIRWQETPLHTRIFAFLDKAFTKPGFRGCINIPPRAGKTHLICMWVAFCYGQAPDANFIYGSSTATLAETSAILVRKIMSTEVYKRVFPKTRLDEKINAKDKFNTTANGGLLARGVEGQVTGFGAGITQEADAYRFGGALIADDLHKVAEARSESAKNGVRTFVTETFNTRVNDPRTPKIYIGQRVAPDDIFGLLSPGDGQMSLTGEAYEVLKITPLDENRVSIWEAKWPTEWCHMTEKAQAWLWATQYLQEPFNMSGSVFQVDMMPVLHGRPPGPSRRVRAWDLAASELKQGKTAPDYTAKCLVAYYPSIKMYLIEDAVMYRNLPHIVRQDIRNTAARDGFDVKISLPQDAGQAGKDQIMSMMLDLPGHKVVVTKPRQDKGTRAEPFAAQLNVGLVGVLAPFENVVKGQLRAFPDGSHDDLVDALSDAYAELAIPDEDELNRMRAVAAYEAAARFNFGPGGERVSLDATQGTWGPGFLPGEEPIL